MIDYLSEPKPKKNRHEDRLHHILNSLLIILKADVVQLLFNPVGQSHFKESSFMHSNFKPNSVLLEQVKEYTQTHMFSQQAEVFDPGSLYKFDISKTVNPYGHWISMPVYIADKRVGIINIGSIELNRPALFLIRHLVAMLEPIFMELASPGRRPLDEEASFLDKKGAQLDQPCPETAHKCMIGQSEALEKTFHLISQVSRSDSTVLILGETGTGKELVAKAIHNDSTRKHKVMIKVNCAALPVNLIESELFGHEKGSFTGATERRLGKFELASGGTLFLDEIGDMPLELQVKLLRALQEKEIERVGGKGPIKVDVRIIAATNRDLEKEMSEGRFRNDLFYRLNIFPICLPPLRQRKQDIEMLTLHFVDQYSKRCAKRINSISSKVMENLIQYHWPGNIRELEHLIERSVLLTTGNIITQVCLPLPDERTVPQGSEEEKVLKTIDQNEKEHIYTVLKYCGGRIAGRGGAAEILGVPPSTLNSKIKRLGIRRVLSM